MKKKKCIALFSGGLDSVLAVKLISSLGHPVQPVFFETPFFEAGTALEVAQLNKISLRVIDIFDEYLTVLQNPRYGYGRNLNPCVDCHGFMFKKAGELLPKFKADFMISGEVLGQRPMSQRRDAMNAVGKLSGLKDLLVRPLSQKLLKDTLPLREGWVDKEKLLDLQGRGRSRQLQLAREFGIKEFQTPAGGCKLTDIKYARRLKDLMKYNQINRHSVKFLKYGRHFRLTENSKLVVGRSKQDNEHISLLVEEETVIKATDIHGPLGVLISSESPSNQEIELAAKIVLRYNNRVGDSAKVSWGRNFYLNNFLLVRKLGIDKVESLMI